MKMLSIIIPVYNEEQNIPNMVQTLDQLLKEHKISYEIIFIDDGSKDQTWEILSSYKNLSYITSIRFSRNFGKEAAISAGLRQVKGDACVVMDCDM
ncbi:MAG: glycosyltransferase, partial [Clostridiales bacterium]|nr:glycosyltransferase [Clostridiales bacterium]